MTTVENVFLGPVTVSGDVVRVISELNGSGRHSFRDPARSVFRRGNERTKAARLNSVNEERDADARRR